MTELRVRCADGYVLHGTEHVPTRPEGIAVLVAPAVFVRERYYTAFARALASGGMRAITWASRGMGRSLAREAPGWRHELRDWGERDLPALIAWVRAEYPDERLFVVGHSMGGQIAGLSSALQQVEGLVTVAATEAWYGHWPAPKAAGILAWYLAIPLLGRALPVIPADRFGLGPDMDARLVRDWARWGRSRRYLYGPHGLTPALERYTGRVLAYSFTDDHLGCRRAVDALHAHFASAELHRAHVSPTDAGVPTLGHFGYFRAATGTTLWSQTAAWIRSGGPPPPLDPSSGVR